MRPGALLVPILLLVAAGCVDDVKKPGASNGPGATSTRPPDNTTVEGVLLQAPHIKVLGPATLAWDLGNATAEQPMVLTTLVLLGGFGSGLKSSQHAFDPQPDLVAFIPVTIGDTITGCGGIPKEAKAYFRLKDGTGGSNFGNLTGEYPAGWYHVVVASTRAAAFRISFEVEKNEVKPRKPVAADPYVGAGVVFKAGAREITHSVTIPEGPWLAWSSHVHDMSTDGGNAKTLTIGDCAKASRTGQPGFGGGGGGGSSSRTLSASGVGTVGSFEIKGTYAPTVAAAATMNTQLYAAWAWVKPIPVQEAGASPTPGN